MSTTRMTYFPKNQEDIASHLRRAIDALLDVNPPSCGDPNSRVSQQVLEVLVANDIRGWRLLLARHGFPTFSTEAIEIAQRAVVDLWEELRSELGDINQQRELTPVENSPLALRGLLEQMYKLVLLRRSCEMYIEESILAKVQTAIGRTASFQVVLSATAELVGAALREYDGNYDPTPADIEQLLEHTTE